MAEGSDQTAEVAAAVARFTAAFAAQDLDAVMAAMTEDCVFESTTPPDGERHVGTAAVRAAFGRFFAANPGARFDVEEELLGDDHGVQLWTYDWGDGHVRGVDVMRVRDGLIAEKRSYVKG